MGRDKRGWVGAFISFSFSTNVSKPRCWALITPRGQRKTSKKGEGGKATIMTHTAQSWWGGGPARRCCRRRVS